jgi:hypothetical protein
MPPAERRDELLIVQPEAGLLLRRSESLAAMLFVIFGQCWCRFCPSSFLVNCFLAKGSGTTDPAGRSYESRPSEAGPEQFCHYYKPTKAVRFQKMIAAAAVAFLAVAEAFAPATPALVISKAMKDLGHCAH